MNRREQWQAVGLTFVAQTVAATIGCFAEAIPMAPLLVLGVWLFFAWYAGRRKLPASYVATLWPSGIVAAMVAIRIFVHWYPQPLDEDGLPLIDPIFHGIFFGGLFGAFFLCLALPLYYFTRKKQ